MTIEMPTETPTVLTCIWALPGAVSALLASACASSRDRGGPNEPEGRRGLIGRWQRISAAKGAEIYPDELEFLDRGTYIGFQSEPARMISLWDTGEYHVLSEEEVRISTANDAEIVYRYSLSGDVLRFVDQDGREFEYRRIK